MPMSMPSRLAPVALLALLAGSGCTLLTKTDEFGPYADAESFCETLVSAYVERMVACEAPVAGLDERLYDHLVKSCPQVGLSAAQGRLVFDAGAAKGCVAEVKAATCKAPRAFTDPTGMGQLSVSCGLTASLGIGAIASGPTPMTMGWWSACSSGSCAAALRGVVGAGGACVTAMECGAGAVCEFGPSTGAAVCPGTCIAPGTPSGPCTFTTASVKTCTPGSYCDGANCQPGYAEGADCSTGGDRCGLGLKCHMEAGPIWRCRVTTGVGGSCATENFCADGLYCDDRSLTCQSFPMRPEPIGGNCGSTRFCGDDAWCDTGTVPATCQARRTSGNCSTMPTTEPQCAVGYGCPSGSCRPYAEAGAACDSSPTPAVACRPGSTCRQTGGPTGPWLCEPGNTPGGSCSGSTGSGSGVEWGCFGDLHCVGAVPSGTCQGYAPPGSSCMAQSDCAGWERGARCWNTCSAVCQ
jgi:hypothetical protein